MKLLKKLVAVFIITIMLFGFASLYNAQNDEYGLLNIYSDNMLFKQNSQAVLAGHCSPGSSVTAALFDSVGREVANGKAQADRSGGFKLRFNTPSGSFNNYKIVVKCNNEVIDSLNDVTFGELWLAGGQSNMQYPLSQSAKGSEMFSKSVKGSEWIRFLSVPAYPEYKNDSDLCPLNPLDDISGCFWLKADNQSIYGNSAVGYFFADEMLKKLNVPIGVIDSNLGGSSIASWLSREAIDSDIFIKNETVKAGEYFEYNSWDENGHNVYRDMTVNYNKKINPLRSFCISGIIWYQGETDFINDWSEERYTKSLALLQKSYSHLFNYDGTIPLVLTQLAPHSYGRMHQLALWNSSLCEFQNEMPESRAVISNYDISLEYFKSVGSIHPSHKYEIGARFADSAFKMVYSDDKNYSCAYIDNYTVEDNSIIIKLKNTGSGIAFNGNILNGFSICDKSGVFVKADAEIISKDSVKVFCENVKEPVAAAYAFCENNHYANLYSCNNDELNMPVSPFITDYRYLKSSWGGNEWADCEIQEIWHLGEEAKYYKTWESKNADITFDSSSAFSGDNGIHISANKKLIKSFSVNPVLSGKKSGKRYSFGEWNTDWSDYSSISFMVKNNGKNNINLSEIVIDVKGIGRYTPALNSGTSTSAVIPADGCWHKITIDLNRLYLYSNDASAYYSNKKIDNVMNFTLKFRGNNADISIDNFVFYSEEFNSDKSITFSADFKNIKGISTFITALFTNLIGLFIK